MESNLFKYIWRHSRLDQGFVLGLVLISLPFYFLSLNLPKAIVNQGIQGKGFASPNDTVPFLRIELPDWLSAGGGTLFDGLALDQMGLLLALSFAFLALVIVNGVFKFVINTLKGQLGERMLRRLRYELGDRILRFPLLELRKVKQAEMATMVKDEVEPLGGFIGDAFVTPAFLGGQALTALFFILWQSLWLGLVAGGIVLVQAFLIPRLRRPILALGRQRQLTARQLAGRIAELVDGAVEIHANDGSNLERADLSSRLGRIFAIRYEIYRRKFFVKFLNNFLAQVTPFIFYAGGGLLALSGKLDIGALVAVIAAYKDLPSPIKELIDWDQQRNDVQIKYEQVIDQFQPSTLLDPARQDADADADIPLAGSLSVASVSLADDSGGALVEGVSFEAGLTEHVAIIGESGSGKDYLTLLLAGLVAPSGGRVRIGGHNVASLPEAVIGRRFGYVGQETYLFAGSLHENLIYGLKHRPLDEPQYEGAALRRRQREIAESLRAANAAFDLAADWVDYRAAGASGPDDLVENLLTLATLVGLESDLYRFGLAGSIDPDKQPELAADILEARGALAERLAELDASDLVVRFDAETYNHNATLAENLLFGTPTRPAYESDALGDNPLVLSVLREEGLLQKLHEMGTEIARTMVEIFADLPPSHPFFEQFSFIEADDLPIFRSLLTRVEKASVDALSEGERRLLLRLPFKYIEARHRLSLIDERSAAQIVAARKRLAEALEAQDPGAVELYRPDAYNDAASLQDNILFGRLAYGKAAAEETVTRAITEVLDTHDLKATVLEVGLDFNVGVGGKRLSSTQRQRIGFARALIKRPDIFIVNDAAAVMDAVSQSRLMARILDERKGKSVIWATQRAQAAERFDRVLVMRGPRLVEQGSYRELKESGRAFAEMIAAE
ncbi:MAG: ATP-binding cassette domain-containing protein [Kiloniellales bacterium]